MLCLFYFFYAGCLGKPEFGDVVIYAFGKTQRCSYTIFFTLSQHR